MATPTTAPIVMPIIAKSDRPIGCGGVVGRTKGDTVRESNPFVV